ncbi:hypothetical protein HNR23_004055 [Nocardiopsis mwathae]|uniref:Uncharacterized protein n=1 Tax=Nocardiopsis mwathae TaxID=1472723 RepID=A0A7W9YKS5_9ACTN|nr:hypothetical protein [Nocardiopsis mwathae]MBB6173995.1 hypothetical protein [Nocardiopsis mwathae]
MPTLCDHHDRNETRLSYEERALRQNRRFMHWVWLLPLCVALGAVATVVTGQSVWTSAGCAAGIALWFVLGSLALWVRRW